MKVVMKKNLGSRDATAYGLDYRDCEEGASVTTTQDVAEALVKSGMAEMVEEAKPVRAVPEASTKATPAETTKAVSETPKGKK